MRRVQGEAARMGKAVQHPRVFGERRNRRTVFLLVQKITRLLPLLHIHPETNAILSHLHMVRHLPVQEAGLLPKPFQFTNGYVVTLINSRRVKLLHQRVHNIPFESLHAQTEHLQHDHVAERVRNHSGQAVAFRKNQPATF